MKKLYIRPVSTVLTIAPSQILAGSLSPDSSHSTQEQYAKETEFDGIFDETDGEEW